MIKLLISFGIPFFKYHSTGPHPIDEIKNIRKDLPILIVCSLQDTTVPAENSIKLYDKLIESGHTKAHLLVLSKGKHSKLLQSEQGEIYQNLVHAFYAKYGLPHNQEYAKLGKNMLQKRMIIKKLG